MLQKMEIQMEVEDFEDRVEYLIECSKDNVLELKRKLNICTSKKKYEKLIEKIILNQENVVYLIDLAKDPEDTMEVYSEEDLEEFLDSIQNDIDNSL